MPLNDADALNFTAPPPPLSTVPNRFSSPSREDIKRVHASFQRQASKRASFRRFQILFLARSLSSFVALLSSSSSKRIVVPTPFTPPTTSLSRHHHQHDSQVLRDDDDVENIIVVVDAFFFGKAHAERGLSLSKTLYLYTL